jgi:hypothetical protein
MPSSRILTNPRKALPGANNDRPSGAGTWANSEYPPDLIAAALYGNRATRRLAKKNLRKKAKVSINGGM